jgi:hypothetical protein
MKAAELRLGRSIASSVVNEQRSQNVENPSGCWAGGVFRVHRLRFYTCTPPGPLSSHEDRYKLEELEESMLVWKFVITPRV